MELESELSKRRRQLREQKEALAGFQSQKRQSLSPVSKMSSKGNGRHASSWVQNNPEQSNAIQLSAAQEVNVPPTSTDSVDHSDSGDEYIYKNNKSDGHGYLMGEDGFFPELSRLTQEHNADMNKNGTEDPIESSDLDCPLSHSLALQNEATEKRPITAIRFHRKFDDVVLTGHSRRADGLPGTAGGVVALWGTAEGRGLLQRTLTAPSPISALEVPAISPTLVICGTSSGGILMWDLRAKSAMPISSFSRNGTSCDDFHGRHRVTAIKTSYGSSPYFVTTSNGGHVCKWSLSQPSCPVSKDILHDETGATELDIESIDFPRTAQLVGEESGLKSRATSLFLGSQDGAVHRVEVCGTSWSLSATSGRHDAAVTAISAHPYGKTVAVLDDILVSSSSDWTIRMWHFRRGQACNQVACYDMVANGTVSDVAWSLQHPTVFCAADEAGFVSIFDVSGHLRPSDGRSHWQVKTPSSGSPSSLTSVQWSPSGRSICTGNLDGTTSIWTCAPSFAGLPDAEWMGQFMKSKVSQGS